MTQKSVNGIIAWLKEWFYDKAEVQALLVSGSLPNLSQKGTFTNSGVTVTTYSDEAYVYVVFSGTLSSSGKTMPIQSTSTIPSAYRPNSPVMSPIHTSSNGYQLEVLADGKVNFWGSTSANTFVATTVMYPVASRIGGVTPVPNSVSLVSDKSVLSAYDSDTCTLSATVLDSSNNPVQSVTVEFFNGATSMGTSSTDSNGVATKSYSATGVGDVTFTAQADSLTSNCTVEDCIYYNTAEISTNYTNNHVTVASLSTLPSSFELTFDYKTNLEARVGLFSQNNFSASNPNYSVFVGSPNGSSSWYYGYRTTSTSTTDVSASPTDYHNYLIKRNGSSFTYKRDGSGNYSKTVSFFDSYNYLIGLMGWHGTSSSSSAKNIKLKKV